MGTAAVCAAMLVGTAAAEEIRPADLTITEAFKAGKLKWLHAALVIYRRETLAEVYFDGSDEQRGRQLGIVHHGPDTLHDIRSITKSVTALLYGIALAEGSRHQCSAFGAVSRICRSCRRSFARQDHRRGRPGDEDGTEWNEDLPLPIPAAAKSPWRIPQIPTVSCWTGRGGGTRGAVDIQRRSGGTDRRADRERHWDGAG